MAGSKNYWRGPWRDTSRGAVDAALTEVGLMAADFIECQFSEGLRLEPVDPAKSAVDVELRWSESRQQHQAILRRLP